AQLGDSADGRAELRQARALSPVNPNVVEALGAAELTIGDPSLASQDFLRALAGWAPEPTSPVVLSRLYTEIGDAEKLAGRPERAYDSFRRAVEMDPSAVVARARLESMEHAAGVEAAPRSVGKQP